MIPSELDEMTSLLNEYFIRDLTSEELDTLNAALESDAKLRQQYAQMTRDEVLLHAVYGRNEHEKKMIPLARKARSPHRGLALAASIALLLSIGSALFLRPKGDPEGGRAKPVAVISDYFVIQGDEIVAEKGDQERTLQLGAPLYMGDEVYLPQGSRLSLAYLADDSTLEFRSNSHFKLLETEGAKHIQLYQGSLQADVDKQDPDLPMRILTDESEIVVVGTEFVFMNDAIERLSVRSGCVQMKERNGDVEQNVFAGYYAERFNQNTLAPRPFEEKHLQASASRTLNVQVLNKRASEKYIVIDPVRHLRGMVSFDVGAKPKEIIEATLRVRVVKFDDDEWGEGTLRVFQVAENPSLVNPRQEIVGPSAQLATYTGKVGAGMNLEFKLDPKKIVENKNQFIIQLDAGGNDFWFSSNKGPFAPELELKFVHEGSL